MPELSAKCKFVHLRASSAARSRDQAFSGGFGVSLGFDETWLRARRRGRATEHGEARNGEPVESLLQAAVSCIQGGDGAAHLGFTADGVGLEKGLLQTSQNLVGLVAVRIDLLFQAVFAHGVAEAASDAKLLKFLLHKGAEFGLDLGLGPLFLQVGDRVDTDNHDADAFGLLLSEDRLAGGFGVADAGERVIGRRVGEAGINAIVLDVADGDAQGGFGVAEGESAVLGAQQARLVAAGEPGAEALFAGRFMLLVEAVHEAAEEAAHGFAEVVAVFAQILDAPVSVALGQLGDQRLFVPELTKLLRDDLFAFGEEEQMPVGVQDVDGEQREAAGAEAGDGERAG